MQNASYLKRASNGVYYVHWTVDRIGKRVSTRTSDLAAAQIFHGTWLLMEKEAPAGVDVTLQQAWDVYREKHVETKVAGVENADLAWRQLTPHFADKAVATLDQNLIDDYVSKRTSGKLGRKVKPQTVAKELSYLLAAVKFCADPRRKFLDAKFGHLKFDLPPPGDPRDRWLESGEIQALRDAATKMRRDRYLASCNNAKRQARPAPPPERLSRVERFLWLAIETAGREEALLELSWDRVDFETNVIVLDVPGRRRTKKRRATVPISKALRPVLLRAYDERINDLVLDYKSGVWAQIQIVVMEAGLAPKQIVTRGKKPTATGISPHVLRHTAATHMARRGVPLWLIAKVLGNTLRMVEKVYAKHRPDDLRDAVDAISAGFLEAAE